MGRALKVYCDTKIFEKPSRNSGILMTINSGSSVSGISMTSSGGKDWAFVSFFNAGALRNGYILCEGDIVALTKVAVHSRGIEIRESPDMNSPIKKTCAIGTKMLIGKKVEANGAQWYEVVDDDASTTLGYVPETSPLSEIAESTESKSLLDRGPIGWILFGLIGGVIYGIIKMIQGN
jgi:hypothetical protein